MLYHRSLLSLPALLSCLSVVVAGPIHSSVYRRGRSVLIGYRYVNAQKAQEYNYYGTLTSVGASGTQLGDGAYISPDINEWAVADTYWQCAIFADLDKFYNVYKMYIPENSNTFYSSSRLSNYLSRARLDPQNTVLFSKISGDAEQHVQMLIPPYYLRASPAFGGAYGNGDLGISVRCVPKTDENTNYYGNAGWGGTWGIPGYGCDILSRRDGTGESCPLLSPSEGPIEIPSSLLPTPSGDISTVSSYSFTESSITATSTALPSGESFFPSGYSSAVPPPVSGVSSGPILTVSSSTFTLPAPISSASSGIATPSASASGQSSAVASSSAPTSSVQSSAGSAPASSGQSSLPAGSSVLVASSSSVASSGQASALSSAAPSAKSGAVTSSSAHPTASSTPGKSSATTTTKPATTTSAKPVTTHPPASKPVTTKPATTKRSAVIKRDAVSYLA
ncbi:hypothetical protein DFH07DRAFT_807312 [Mycena maculata]|uniref:Uncharacterized protein n=1 Tax=Mycena maculata TaxID=230809 RepID=A0AAD7JSH7_9AGAR|nr:hypothetical protein DFH07DRAFT_807312 [Mycena maculata]